MIFGWFLTTMQMELHCINSFVLGLLDESNVADTLWGCVCSFFIVKEYSTTF